MRHSNLLKIQHPIIQAPMAGVATPELVAAVSNEGALGSLAVGYMSPRDIINNIQAIKRLTSKPFLVNLFVYPPYKFDQEKIALSKNLLTPYCQELDINPDTLLIRGAENFEAQVAAVLECNVPIVSFTFGIPEMSIIKKFKSQGTVVIGTATTLEEAKLLEEGAMDVIVAQGSEAGGHRGTFTCDYRQALIPLAELIKTLSEAIKTPIIAAGGIMNGEGIRHAIQQGATAAQMGTAFLTCDESSAHPAYKQKILQSKKEETALTCAFSGKAARGILNRFMKEMAPYENQLPDYPIQHYLTQSLRQRAAQQDNTDFMSLWAGQHVHLARTMSIKQLISTLTQEMGED